MLLFKFRVLVLVFDFSREKLEKGERYRGLKCYVEKRSE